MSPTRIGAALALLALALLALPGGSSGDSSSPTWEGTWSSTFGDIKMTASGSGTYPNCGTISGSISGDEGRTNKGTWQECSSNGKYEFHMSGSGLTFDGSYTRGESDSCVFPPCTWDGTCISGACLENDDPAPARPPHCGAASFLADAAAEGCDLGSLPIGKRVTVDSPKPGKTKDISPREIPELNRLILEILAEQEAERLAAALAAKFGAKEAHGLIAGCFVVAQGGFEEEHIQFDKNGLIETKKVLSREGMVAIYNACARLLLSPEPPASAARRARVAATGCRVIVVPVFEKGTKVTKRRRKQARAAILEQVKPSCDDKRKGFTASLKARGKGATLNRVTGKNIGAPLARLSDTPANGRRVSVRWTAARR
jgi:hypothetical protein